MKKKLLAKKPNEFRLYLYNKNDKFIIYIDVCMPFDKIRKHIKEYNKSQRRGNKVRTVKFNNGDGTIIIKI